MNTNKYLIDAINEIKNIIQKLNTDFFDSELPEIPVYLTPNLRKIACFSAEDITVFDRTTHVIGHINLSDHILSLPIENVCAELLHVMCHHYCHIHNIKDCSRAGNYHNKKFMRVALLHGLIVGYNKVGGWEITTASQELIDWCSRNFDRNYSLSVFRYKANYKKGTGNNSVRYVCPVCGSIARKTDHKPLVCGLCFQGMLCTG